MNIISNTCIGAYITRDILKQKYCNPFCWNIIDYVSMVNLINQYDQLKVLPVNSFRNANNNYATILISNNITIQYVHIKEKLFQSIVNKTQPNEDNIFVENCATYAIEKYKERLQRMTEPPVFILQVQSNHPITGNIQQLHHLINTVKTTYHIIIVTKEKLSIQSKNIHILNEFDELTLNKPKLMAIKLSKQLNMLSK